MKNIAIFLVTTVIFISCRATLVKNSVEKPMTANNTTTIVPLSILRDPEGRAHIPVRTIYLQPPQPPQQYDPKRINQVLDKIDRIGDMQDLLIKSQKSYFRVVDSIRNLRVRERTKDSSIAYLKAFIINQSKRDAKQDGINDRILKYQQQMTADAEQKQNSSKFLDWQIYVGFAVILLFQIAGFFHRRK